MYVLNQLIYLFYAILDKPALVLEYGRSIEPNSIKVNHNNQIKYVYTINSKIYAYFSVFVLGGRRCVF